MLLELLGLSSRKTLVERLADRFVEAVEQATGSVERSRDRATEFAGATRRRTSERLRDAGERARAGRDAVSERVDSIHQRAAEIRAGREERRQHRHEQRQRVRARRRRRRRGPERPMQLNVSRDDRIVLRGRRPIDVRMTDGGMVRYRFHERPSFWLRAYLHITGRQVWPRR